MTNSIPIAMSKRNGSHAGRQPTPDWAPSREGRSPLEALVSFTSLTHRGHSCRAAAIGIATVASYALKHLGDDIKAEIFQLPDEFANWLEDNDPKVACFSNFIWNVNLSYEFARRIKAKSSDCIVVFGGPNYPLIPEEQKAFLEARPSIDFYVFREGEQSFVELFDYLDYYDFDVSALKRDRVQIPHVHYMIDGQFVQGNLLPQIRDLDEIPSPYLTGIVDKSLEQGHIPIMETKKGCPFHCSFCEDGHDRANLVRSHTIDRVRDELEYIAARTSVPRLLLADLNFGMYREDLEVCRAIASLQERLGWPKHFHAIIGKNMTERVLEAASIVKDTIIGAAVQSIDEQVLKNIKRENISLESYLERAAGAQKAGGSSFSELILCLPGDSKEAHYMSNATLMDAGIGVIRSHQLLLLPGAEVASKEYRSKFAMKTRFRVDPQTAGIYELYGEEFTALEIDEVCVESDTMSFEDYLECRDFNLTVEIFYNSGIHRELLAYLRRNGVSISEFIFTVHDRARASGSTLNEVYDGFARESRELSGTLEELLEFLSQEGILEKYRAEELGNNEQLMYRAIAIIHHMEELHRIAYAVANEMLSDQGDHTDHERAFLSELAEFSLARKQNVLSTDLRFTRTVHYDFEALMMCNFSEPLDEHRAPDGLTFEFVHTQEQRETIAQYVKLYGVTNNGLGDILNMAQIETFYRESTPV